MTWAWIGFIAFVLIMLALDLGVFHKKNKELSLKEALIWCAIWIGLALLFNLGIYFILGKRPALEFLTGYLIEKSLSVDNLFVFLMVFSYFRVPKIYQHGVLFVGMLSALIMRAGFIYGGIALIHKFEWIIYVFGAFLIFTGIKMVTGEDKEIHPEKSIFFKLISRVFPVHPEFDGGNYLTKINGKWHLTKMFLVLMVIEATDLIFAFDSIPAIIAITQDTFIVYTSNIFAILGLRSLYFALAKITDWFHYIKYALCIILVFVGTKMLIAGYYKIPILVSLSVIATVLLLSIVASILWPKKDIPEI
ncbi:MAG: TerC family protein [Candidatus Firestonebacteria bacterium]